MAEQYPDPSTGGVTMPSGHGADINSFDYNEVYACESVAAYGSQTWDPYRSNGTPHAQVGVSAFAKLAATGKSPGLGAGEAGGFPVTATGTHTNTYTAAFVVHSASTSTASNVTITGHFVLSDIRFSHSKLRAAVPISFTFHNAADLTVNWPVS